MIQLVKVEGEQPSVFFTWEGDAQFELKEAPRDEAVKLSRECKKTVYRNHRPEPELDVKRYAVGYVKLTVVGWRGMTGRAMLSACRSDVALMDSVRLADPIEFTPENLDFLAQNCNGEFATFLTYSLRNIGIFRAEAAEQAKAAEIENLPPASDGR